MLVKLNDTILEYAPKLITHDGKRVFNPSDEILKLYGYKELVTSEMPEDAPDGKMYISTYSDKGETIVQEWVLANLPPKSREELAVELAAKQINTMVMSDNESLYFIALYPTWEDLCDYDDGKGYKAKTKGFKFSYFDSEANETKLYKTVQDNFTFQSQWIPGQGTSAIYTQIVETQEGTLDDPIDVPEDITTNSFTYIIGKYYRWNEKIYHCERQGEEEGTEHSFNYSPDQLIGNYFKLVE